jgi:phosphohistidine swiveling domain-containing protein
MTELGDRWLTDWDPSPRWPHYTRANAGEVLPSPVSPLGWTFVWENGILLGWRDGYVRQGLYEVDEWDSERPEVAGTFGGYFFVNLANVRMQGVRNPAVTVEQLDMAFFGDHPDVPPYTAHPDDEKPHLTEAILAHIGWVSTTTEWPELLDDRETVGRLRTGRPDLTQLTDSELVERARAIQPLIVHLFDQHTVTSSSSGMPPGMLFAIGEAIGDPSIPMRLLAGIGDVDSAEPSYALWDLSRAIRSSAELTDAFDQGLDGLAERLASATSDEVIDFLRSWSEFLAEFGSRGPNEWEIYAETWETNPAIALAALDRIRGQRDEESPRIRNSAVAADRESLTAEVRAAVADNEELAGMLEAALVAAKMLAWRERTKTNIIKAVHEVRMAFRELGRRLVERGEIADAHGALMVTDSELDAFVADPTAFSEIVAERHAGYLQLADLEPPFIIAGGAVPPLSQWLHVGESEASELSRGESIQGVPGSPGKVTGRARIINDPAAPGGLEPGDIMVASLTDPAWTPLFMAADGVVVNVGGQISHAIIVSRELGLPCVVSATDATTRIPDGAMIEVDGTTGTVTRL